MIELKFISKSHTGTELVINNARVAIQKVGQDSMLYRLILDGNAIFCIPMSLIVTPHKFANFGAGNPYFMSSSRV